MTGNDVVPFVGWLFLPDGKNGTIETKAFVGRSENPTYSFVLPMHPILHRSDTFLSAGPDMRYGRSLLFYCTNITSYCQ